MLVSSNPGSVAFVWVISSEEGVASMTISRTEGGIVYSWGQHFFSN